MLPFKTPGWKPRAFILCQFYAGDSRSVSHKNVDQTSATRAATLKLDQDAHFVAYLDGAGYFASLNGDLRSLLAMVTIASFLQIRSAPIRLRRVIQEIGFLCPTDVARAVFVASEESQSVRATLIKAGFAAEEVDHGIRVSIETGFVAKVHR